MINKLKKTSIFFWITSGILFILALWGGAQVMYSNPQFINFFSIIPDIIVKPLFNPITDTEKTAIAISCLLLAIPVIFASIAIVIGKVAKALEEQNIQIISLPSENKEKSKEE